MKKPLFRKGFGGFFVVFVRILVDKQLYSMVKLIINP
jgi:hypothetical protein